MAMVKVFSPSGWDFDSPVASLIKIASDGLHGNDRRAFIKRASGAENIFLPYLDSIKFAEDLEPVHLIALGAKENYGANRNGDAFSAGMLKRCHDTFVKFGRYNRNHKNKQEHNHFGIVKLSAYNEPMSRVELLVGMFKTKEATEKYTNPNNQSSGGMVADKELEKLANGEDIPVSMAIRVPYDECSFCNHRSRTRDEYCTPSMCKAGGCADNLTRLIKVGDDLHHLHVNNPDGTFFDISGVFRPADRIAYGGKADWLNKAASDNGFFGIGGAKMAEDLAVMAPRAVILAENHYESDPCLSAMVKLAHGLAVLERSELYKEMPAEVRRAFSASMQPSLNLDLFDMRSTEKIASVLGALADEKIILPLRDFARMTKCGELLEAASSKLPGVYQRMIDDGTLEGRLINNVHAPSEKLASARDRQLASKLRKQYSLEKSAVDERLKLSILGERGIPNLINTYEKTAADSGPAEELARNYATYKVAALRRIADNDPEFMLTACIALVQNSVI